MKKDSLYLTLYESLRKKIVSGDFPTGSKLPSKRTSADHFGVSVITVEHAYELLSDEGYITSRERSGYYITYNEEEIFPASHRQRDPMPFPSQRSETEFPFSVYAKAMRKALSLYGEALFVKSPGFGWMPLRHAIAGYLARSRGIHVSEQQVIIGSGAEYLYSLIARFLGRKRIFGIENPCYEKIGQVYRAYGITCDLLELDTNGIRTDYLKKTKATVLHITPYRSFPSDITATASKKHEYLQWAAQCGGLLIEDDFSSEFTASTKPEETLFSLGNGHQVLYLNTFSSTVAPAVRTGYLVLPESLVDDFTEKVGFYSCTVPTLEQQVLADLINNGDFERHLNRVRRKKRSKKNN